MAGLTKAQKAERAAQTAQKPADDQPEATSAELVRMTKDGEQLDVHPTCVADHQRIGWKLKS